MRNNLGLFVHILRKKDANFGIITAIAIIPLILSFGGAADLNSLYRASASVQDAADGAALAAAKRMETGTAAEAKAEAEMFGRLNLPQTQSDTVFNATIDTDAGTVTVVAKGSVKPAFLKLVRIDELPFERVATAALRRKGFMDFHFLIDVSESMNIAATEVDRKTLETISKKANNRPCAFACHIVEPSFGSKSVWQMNEDAGVGKARLRIDVLREAADTMIDRLLDLNQKPEDLLDIRVQTGGFGSAFEKGSGPGTNASDLKASIRKFAIANNHTNFAASLGGFSSAMGLQGDGKAAATPRKVALLITDGVRDEGFSRPELGPMPAGLCDQIKAKGIDLAILEVSYVENYDVGNYYRDRVAWYYPQISPALKSCATSGLYYKVADTQEASKALIHLTDMLVTRGMRLTK